MVECKDNISGIVEVFLNEYVEIPRSYFIDNNFDVSGFQKITPKQLYGANASQSYNSFSFDQVLSFKTPNLLNDALLKGYQYKRYRAIVRDYKGFYWLLGKENGLYISDIKSSTGLNYNDFSGYEIEFKGMEKDNFQTVIYNNNNNENVTSSSGVLSSSNLLASN